MKHQYAVWCLSIATLGLSGTANAAVEWWTMSSRGEQPKREVFYADLTSVVQLNKESGMTESPRALDVLQVQEATGSPEYINYRFQFQCASKLIRVISANAGMSSGADFVASVPSGWNPVRPHWTELAYQFACQPQARQQNGMVKLESNMLGGFVGDLDVSQVAEKTRKAVWGMQSVESDVTRGLYPKEIKEIRRKQVASDIRTLFDASNLIDLPSK
ncbi:hypothetical protein QY702_20965 [Xanthomonas campestris pv. plantaginis]|uniref:hypothetical protein n=1 Tax=Xanthomonas campestris TaxID=339 RepID=UPI002B225AF1|nr:hypothetical protein [Xanthomonas campestris]MEA9608824.1 hypothetical protein [Xanthomonas campestris pv. plantaginis]